MKNILLGLFILIGFISEAQVYIPATAGTPTNKALAIAQAASTDARTLFFDSNNFVYRPFVSTSEVLSYLTLSKYRFGWMDIIVNTGGTLGGNGVIIGGVNNVYYFKNGTADGDLVLKTSTTVYDSAAVSASINKRVVAVTIAQLRAMTNPSDTVIYYVRDAGKQGNWYYDASDVSSVDNLGTILVSGTKRFKRIYFTYLDPRWFGIDGLGNTDNSQALNTALTYGSISVPDSFKIRLKNVVRIPSNRTIVGGKESNIWINADDFTWDDTWNPGAVRNAKIVVGVDSANFDNPDSAISISNINFRLYDTAGTVTNMKTILRFSSIIGLNITNCKFVVESPTNNGHNTAIDLHSAWKNVYIANNSFNLLNASTNFGGAIWVQNTGNTVDENAIIENNIFNAASKDETVAIYQLSASGTGTTKTVKFLNNIMTKLPTSATNGSLLTVFGRVNNIQIDGNEFVDSASSALIIDGLVRFGISSDVINHGSNIQLTNNHIYGTLDNSDGFKGYSMDSVYLYNNTIKNYGAQSVRNGISGPNSNLNGAWVIEGNKIYNFFNGISGGSRVQGNIINSCKIGVNGYRTITDNSIIADSIGMRITGLGSSEYYNILNNRVTMSTGSASAVIGLNSSSFGFGTLNFINNILTAPSTGTSTTNGIDSIGGASTIGSASVSGNNTIIVPGTAINIYTYRLNNKLSSTLFDYFGTFAQRPVKSNDGQFYYDGSINSPTWLRNGVYIPAPLLVYKDPSDPLTNYAKLYGFWATDTAVTGVTTNGTAGPAKWNLSVATGANGNLPGSSNSRGVIFNAGAIPFFHWYSSSGATGNFYEHGFTMSAASGTQRDYALQTTVNQSGTASFAIDYISPYLQATGSGTKLLIDAGTDNSSFTNHTRVFSVDYLGKTSIGGTAAQPSAILELQSTTQGFRTTVMTAAQRLAISSPAAGLIVFDTDTAAHFGYTGAGWYKMTGLASSSVAWGAITGTLSSQTDLQSALNLKLNISDTSAMLTPYQTALNVRTAAIALKMSYTDTAAMLAAYQTALNSRALNNNALMTGLLTVTATTQQFKMAYDASNRTDFTTSSSGNLTIQPSGSTTTILGAIRNDATSANANFYIQSGTGIGGTVSQAQYLFGGASNVQFRIGYRGSTATTLTANSSYAGFLIGEQGATEGTSGNHAWLTGAAIKGVNVTAGPATVGNVATLYVDTSRSTTVVSGEIYGIYSPALKHRLDGQLSLGAATTSSAILSATSTTKGFLPPAMTTTQKNAISSPAEGLIVYDLTLHKLCVFTGTVWETVTSL